MAVFVVLNLRQVRSVLLLLSIVFANQLEYVLYMCSVNESVLCYDEKKWILQMSNSIYTHAKASVATSLGVHVGVSVFNPLFSVKSFSTLKITF